ncbi:tRNA lysidine(34) synthetase TilS [Candidatus Omnitrophota bacterium]
MNASFQKKVIDFCEQHSLFTTGDAVLVSLSGGGDSVGLLHVLYGLREQFGISLEAAHLNHSLRGKESDEDERFCRKLCKHVGIHLTVLKLPEGEITQKKESIETAARDARRSFLLKTICERGLSKSATGHTVDDQAETILQRIMRGTGPSGLQGMSPCSDLVVRPLLGVSRDEVRCFLSEHGILYREDSSNEDTAFYRNRIRHGLIPYMQQNFSPAVAEALSRLGELSFVRESYLKEQAHVAFSACCIHKDSNKILLDNQTFMGYHKVMRQLVVRQCLKLLEGEGRDTDMNEIEHVLRLVQKKHGIHDITSEIRCEAGEKNVVFSLPATSYTPLPLNVPGETVIPMDGGKITAEERVNGSDADGKVSVVVNPCIAEKYGDLTVGLIKSGERMTPSGMGTPVKIRDILSAASLPELVRDSIPVIRVGGIAVWIPGIRSSELLKTGPQRKDKNKSVKLTFSDGLQWLV